MSVCEDRTKEADTEKLHRRYCGLDFPDIVGADGIIHHCMYW